MRQRRVLIFRYVCCFYLAVIVLVLGFIFFVGESHWAGTILLFAPRWVFGLPLIVLVPLAVFLDLSSLLLLLAAGMLILGPLTGLCIRVIRTSEGGEHPLRIVSCNLGGTGTNRKLVTNLVKDVDADIVAFQETPREIPLDVPPEWNLIREGEIVITSKFPLKRMREFQTVTRPHRFPRTILLCCDVTNRDGEFTFCSVHLPSPRYGIQKILDRRTLINITKADLLVQETAYRRETALQVAALVRELPNPVIVAGDFNMPDDSSIYRESWGGYANLFSQQGRGFGWTVKEVIRGIPVPARIDHVLVGQGFIGLACVIGSNVGSDHLPVIAEVARRKM